MTVQSGPPRRRPPWWPDDEPWPPYGSAWTGNGFAWARGWRGSFGCLPGCLVVLLLLLVVGALLAHIPWLVQIAGLLILLAILGVLLRIVFPPSRVDRRVIDGLVDAASRVQDGDYSARVPEAGSPASRLLATAFNRMSEQLGVAASQRRSTLADVSHELRTPLSVIQGQLEAIRDGVYPADAAHLVPALEQVAVLDRLIEDLRTLALSDAGSLTLDLRQGDLAALVAEVTGSFQAAAAAGGVLLQVRTTGPVSLAWFDAARMASVIRNLLANALRHTPQGGSVTVTVGAPGPMVMVEVRDTGAGIDPALLPKVFDRFSRAADSTGSGLGLAIARAIVEAHGGTIEATSAPGAGTTITFRIPAG